MPSLFQILKTSKLGPQAAPDMLMALVAKNRAGDGKIRTLTGIPPLSFKSSGKPLMSWSMKGNAQQTGTPTPDAPIMPTFCGVRAGNLAKYWKAAYVTVSGTVNANKVNGVSFPVKIEAGQTVCFTNQKTNFGRGIAVFSGFDGETPTDMIYRSTNSTVTYTADSDCYVITWGNYDNTTSMDESVFALCCQMLNLGSTALPYEPYGYKIPITCAGQTTPVYLGEVPTVREIKCVDLGTLTYNRTPSGNFSAALGDGKVVGNTEIAPAICSHFKVVSANNHSSTPYSVCVSINNHSYISINKTGFEEMTVTEFKAAMSGVLLWYVLAEPETGIVNEPLAKIGDYADELHSTIPIPTVKGANTLTVDTELQPSEMTITGHIKQMQFVYVTDSDGVYCFDADGVQIIEEV